MKTIVLGGGCFWCLEAAFLMINGVEKVVSGYAGGTLANPDYETVCTGETGHAEVVEITYDPTVVSLQQLLTIFWTVHDPTTLNRQGNDVGTQYRSVIFYTDKHDKETITASLAIAQENLFNPIVTEVKPLEIFYPAEDYHQKYFEKNPEQAYCQAVITPKLFKLRQKFPDRLA